MVVPVRAAEFTVVEVSVVIVADVIVLIPLELLRTTALEAAAVPAVKMARFQYIRLIYDCTAPHAEKGSGGKKSPRVLKGR